MGGMRKSIKGDSPPSEVCYSKVRLGPKTTTKKKMPKRNGFFMFMEDRKSEILKSGRQLTRGHAELAELLSDEWTKLSAKEKERYTEKATKWNERNGVGTNTGPVNKSQVHAQLLLDAEKRKQELQAIRIKNRSIVQKGFEAPNWRNMRVAVCCFSLYIEPEIPDELYIPAEIGLTTFTLLHGVCDNFGRIIDPGVIPQGFGSEVARRTEKMGIPAPGLLDDFKDYKNLTEILTEYLEGSSEWTNYEDLCVFCLDSDFEQVSNCWEWMAGNAGMERSVKVLSLNLYAHLASTQNNMQFRKDVSGSTPSECKEPKPTAISSSVRKFGEPLHGSFIYPTELPLVSYGLFSHESEVEDVLKRIDNYKYYDELCCMYHNKIGDRIHFCTLNTANRYTFSLLEILTLSNEVEVVTGKHFPEFDKPMTERYRRYEMLTSWGVTAIEKQLEEPPVRPDVYGAWSKGAHFHPPPKCMKRVNGVPVDSLTSGRHRAGFGRRQIQEEEPPAVTAFVPRRKN